MKRLLAITCAAAVAVAVSLAPAAAKSKKYRYQAEQDYYDEPYQQQGWNNGWNGGWTNRTVSDPSFGNRAGINRARSYGRCVEDLGYGRYEYCGW